MIGVVDTSAIEPGDNFFKVDVKFAVDYNKLDHVYVVKNLFADELRKLENQEIQ
jgi:hypothetical protein